MRMRTRTRIVPSGRISTSHNDNEDDSDQEVYHCDEERGEDDGEGFDDGVAWVHDEGEGEDKEEDYEKRANHGHVLVWHFVCFEKRRCLLSCLRDVLEEMRVVSCWREERMDRKRKKIQSKMGFPLAYKETKRVMKYYG